eukprot:TRINITY_DN38029_c0_g1_i1.p1 TRINITY_DN38029_c0_g1~~TRINITY_DN38029_c0_g1_i1.p1  ORF type:complete len:432 (-),score=102.00 TRINITY_DN38029_c0_g1_i1:118-1263(-)
MRRFRRALRNRPSDVVTEPHKLPSPPMTPVAGSTPSENRLLSMWQAHNVTAGAGSEDVLSMTMLEKLTDAELAVVEAPPNMPANVAHGSVHPPPLPRTESKARVRWHEGVGTSDSDTSSLPAAVPAIPVTALDEDVFMSQDNDNATGSTATGSKKKKIKGPKLNLKRNTDFGPNNHRRLLSDSPRTMKHQRTASMYNATPFQLPEQYGPKEVDVTRIKDQVTQLRGHTFSAYGVEDTPVFMQSSETGSVASSGAGNGKGKGKMRMSRESSHVGRGGHGAEGEDGLVVDGPPGTVNASPRETISTPSPPPSPTSATSTTTTTAPSGDGTAESDPADSIPTLPDNTNAGGDRGAPASTVSSTAPLPPLMAAKDSKNKGKNKKK